MSQIRTLDALSFMQSKETPDQMKLISICKLIWWQVVSVKMHTSSFTQFVYVTVAFFVSIKTVLPTVCVFVQGALVRTRLGFLWACLRFFFGSCSWRSICSKRPLGPLPSTHSYTHPHIHTHTLIRKGNSGFTEEAQEHSALPAAHRHTGMAKWAGVCGWCE